MIVSERFSEACKTNMSAGVERVLRSGPHEGLGCGLALPRCLLAHPVWIWKSKFMELSLISTKSVFIKLRYSFSSQAVLK